MDDTPALSPSHHALLDFIMAYAPPEAVLAFEIPESERHRALELLERRDQGTLTPDESAQLQEMLVIEGILMNLKARAKQAKA